MYSKEYQYQLERMHDIDLNLPSTYIDQDGVSGNAHPYGKLHDSRPDEVDEYKVVHLRRLLEHHFHAKPGSDSDSDSDGPIQ